MFLIDKRFQRAESKITRQIEKVKPLERH
jgi:hypothetical protein